MHQTLPFEPRHCAAGGGQPDGPVKRLPDHDIRRAGPDALAFALQESRRTTLATFQRWQQWLGGKLPRMRAPAELNPPLWELGHVGWFQFSLVTLLANTLVCNGSLPMRQAAWYTKTIPTFSDALEAVRAHWWRAIGLATSRRARDMIKVPRSVFRRLHGVACYAA